MATNTDLAVDTQALSRVPGMITTVRQGMATLPALASTPSAAAATGSPPMAAAIGAFGAGLLWFLGELVEALDEDIDALEQSIKGYEVNEQATSASATTIGNQLGALEPAR